MPRRHAAVVAAVLLVLYVGSYLGLSRPAFAEARRTNTKGFYFFPPQNTARWRYLNYACVSIYYPLIVLDNGLGCGRWPASEPLWGLSK
jgi:hypothetical protein